VRVPSTAGKGATVPTSAELRALSAAARTPNDQRVLEEYYLTLADRQEQIVPTCRDDRRIPWNPATNREQRCGGTHARTRALIHRQLAYIPG
jgi:hypothetical protein